MTIKSEPKTTPAGFRRLEQIIREGDVPLSDHELVELRFSLMNHAMGGGERDELIKVFLRLTNELVERRREAELFAKLVSVAEDVIATRDSRARFREELKSEFLEPKKEQDR